MLEPGVTAVITLERDRAARAVGRAQATLETAREILAAADRAAEDARLMQQMAQMIRDGGAEYMRAISVLERIRDAHSLESAKHMARRYLSELGR